MYVPARRALCRPDSGCRPFSRCAISFKRRFARVVRAHSAFTGFNSLNTMNARCGAGLREIILNRYHRYDWRSTAAQSPVENRPCSERVHRSSYFAAKQRHGPLSPRRVASMRCSLSPAGCEFAYSPEIFNPTNLRRLHRFIVRAVETQHPLSLTSEPFCNVNPSTRRNAARIRCGGVVQDGIRARRASSTSACTARPPLRAPADNLPI